MKSLVALKCCDTNYLGQGLQRVDKKPWCSKKRVGAGDLGVWGFNPAFVSTCPVAQDKPLSLFALFFLSVVRWGGQVVQPLVLSIPKTQGLKWAGKSTLLWQEMFIKILTFFACLLNFIFGASQWEDCNFLLRLVLLVIGRRAPRCMPYILDRC